VEHVRRSRAAANALGRRRSLSATAAAGALIRRLHERFGPDLRDLGTDEDTVEFTIEGARNVETLTLLRDDPELAFFFLADAAAVDYGVGERFEVVYHLYSDRHPAWLRVRAVVDRADPRLPSITPLWEGAMFHEREMYDMMGIVFEGNRDLRRIYMSPDYLAFPLRKDFLLPDDASRSPGQGIRPIETPQQPAETGRRAVMRLSPGTGAVLGPDGERLAIRSGTPAGVIGDGSAGRGA
jgi:NADH-quinone oxidoreductase subunit C